MRISDARYHERNSVTYGFLGGLAGWMTDNSFGGGSVTTETTNGGRAVLSTGTSATGDSGRIDVDPMTPNPGDGIDAVGLRCTFGLDNGGSDPGGASVQIGWLNDTDLHRIYHQPNEVENDRDMVRVSVSDTDTFYDTRQHLSTNILETELIWDHTADELIHSYQDIFSARVTGGSNLPDSTTDYTAKFQISTKDTAQDRTMYLYEVEVAYYQRADN